MPISILHIGDTHRRPGARAHDLMDALSQIVSLLREWVSDARDIGPVLWPGDIFHGVTTAADRNAITEVVVRIAAMAPVIIVRGNHDEDGELAVLERLATTYPVTVVETPQVVSAVSTRSGTPVHVYALPYPHKAMLIRDGITKPDLVDAGRAALDQLCVEGAQALCASLEADPRAIACVAAHVSVSGAIASTGQPQIGKDMEMAPASLDVFPPAAYIALNHIHKHQVVGRGVYAGSICRMDYSENDPKGVIEVTCEPQASTWRFIELSVPRQVTLSCVLTPTAIEWDVPPTDEVIGADVRVQYRYVKAAGEHLDEGRLRAALPRARSVKPVGKPIVTTVLRAPAVTAATTLPDKARAWCALEGVAWTDGLQQKLDQLLREVH